MFIPAITLFTLFLSERLSSDYIVHYQMLIREPFRQNFYDAVRKKHVVIVVANDIDALCAATILMHLFSCDDVPFSVVPIATWTCLEKTLHEHFQQDSNFVLLNCGGSREATKLPLPPNSTIFIVDSRRPIDVDNVYHDEQIKVVAMGKEIDEELKIPSFESVFMEESDEEDEDEEEEEEDDEGIDENGANKRRNRMENMEKRILKNEGRKRWEKKRADILWDYYENAWVSTGSCVVMLNVAAELSRATAELVWITSIALSSQLTDGDISMNGYTLACLDHMKPYLGKFAPRGQAKADDLLRIKFERELPLALYHHWSLFQAMKVNVFFSCQTKNWTQRGEHEMKHLLANIGLTLNECRQKFTAMTLERRTEVVGLLEKAMECKFVSFFVHLGFNERVSACDVARSLSTWMGSVALDAPSSPQVDDVPGHRISCTLADRFEDCRALLTSFITATTDMQMLHRMMASSRSELEGIWQHAATAINQSEIMPNGHYYLFSTNRPRDSSLHSRASLFTFSHFLASAFSSSRKGRNQRPLVVILPSKEEGWLLVLGIMPLATIYADNHLKSFMGRTFEQVAKRPRINMRRDFFDSNIVLLKSEDRGRFTDNLQSLLEGV